MSFSQVLNSIFAKLRGGRRSAGLKERGEQPSLLRLELLEDRNAASSLSLLSQASVGRSASPAAPAAGRSLAAPAKQTAAPASASTGQKVVAPQAASQPPRVAPATLLTSRAPTLVSLAPDLGQLQANLFGDPLGLRSATKPGAHPQLPTPAAPPAASSGSDSFAATAAAASRTAPTPAAPAPAGRQTQSDLHTLTNSLSRVPNISPTRQSTGAALPTAPTVTISGLPASGHVQEGSAVTVQAKSDDPTVTYSWAVTKNGAAFASGTSQKLTFTPNDNGNYSVAVTVRNLLGQKGNAAKALVGDNVAPTGAITGAGSVNLGAAISLKATATDPSAIDAAAGFSYAWNFGDGTTGTGANASHAYATAGSYSVTLTTTDKDGGKSVAGATIQVKPATVTADAGGPYSGGVGASIAFAGAGTSSNPSDTLSYTWAFGDGATATGATASHTYAVAGSYTATLTVSNGRGVTSSDTAAVSVTTVSNPTPPAQGVTADARGPYWGNVGTSIAFAGAGTSSNPSDTLSYTWAFGDGATATGATASHTYAVAGSYTATLTVSNGRGDSSSDTAHVTVVDPSNDPLDKPVLNEANFTYLGSFKMPTNTGTWTTAYTDGGLTYRYVDGQLHFLSTAHVYSGGEVYEVTYPGLGTDDTNLPTATLYRNWGDVYTGHKWVGNDGGSNSLNSGVETYGLYYDDNLDRLYWNYGHWYNASNPYNPSFGYSTLNDTTGVATGVGAWSLVDRPEKFDRGGTLRIPQWFADRFTEGKTLGVGFGGYFSIAASASFGPALAAVGDPNILTNPDRSALDNVPLIGYPSGASDRGHRNPDYHSTYDNGAWNPQNGTGYWTWSDFIYGSATWIDTPNLQGVLFLAKVGEGEVYYQGSTLHATRGAYQWFVYDPKDLADVATGVKQQWEIQPKATWMDNGTLPSDTDGYSGFGFHNVGGVTFDSTTNTLYVEVSNVYPDGREYYPQVYAYKVG